MIDSRRLVLLAYLIPIFFMNIQVGYHEVFLKGHYFLYPVIFFLLFVSKSKEYLTAAIGSFLVLLLVNIGYEYASGGLFASSQYYMASVVSAVVFSVGWVVVLYAGERSFVGVVEFFSKITLALVLISKLILIFTGFSILIDPGYGDFRPHAFMSEPSALSFVCAYIMTVSFVRRDVYWFLLAVLALYLIKSIIAIAVSLAVVLLVFSRRSVFTSIAVLMFLVFVVATNEMFLINVLGHQYERLESGILAVISGGEEGYNPRVIIANAVISILYDNDALYTGLGLNSMGVYPVVNETWSLNAASLPFFLIFSYGLPIMLSIYMLVLLLCINIYRNNDFSPENILFFALALTVTINAAQGMLIYSMFFGMLIFKLISFRKGSSESSDFV